MAPKHALTLALTAYLGLLGCNNPGSLPQVSNESSFDFSKESPFNWNLKKADVESSPLHIMSNSKNIRAKFANFGEVQYQLFFDWDNDFLSIARISLAESDDITVIIDTLYSAYVYLFVKQVSFAKMDHKLSKAEFMDIIQKQGGSPHLPKPVYLPINSVKRNYISIFISNSAKNMSKKYQAVLQISRS